ncbi:c-type cytochrome [Pseudothauera nasutitermitis]|uniref:C-type cytochrome n=1 Tax=Pseudothauera nasutitermitis TaxID=2565930 RepID=A0A4S4B2K7_9RHOO|nr:cytochrome c [Pseudothauera nasutitermitis]THF66425.1 c-type cytochrome [Pseudothauera nasutitermitis]
MNTLKKILLAGAAAFAAAFLIAWSTPYWYVPRLEAEVDFADRELIARGRYLAHAGDCAACHTAPGGKPFAGGLGMQTPLGTIYSTNITPDKDSGIGHYSYADFERAVRRGLRPDGVHLYPAMPYPSYVIVEDEDIQALYAYFMSEVAAVSKANQPSTIPWPLNMRWPLGWWQLAYARPRSFEPDPEHDASVRRGAYLVEGLAHCGACHTPRGIGFQETALRDDASGRFLSGSVLEGWYAKNLRGEDRGLSTWSADEIVNFLKTGRTARSAAFGSMADVIAHSTRHLHDGDLRAIADYLKQLPPRKGREARWTPREDTTTAALRAGDYAARGALQYVEHCALCHRLDGRGAPRIFPALADNSIVFAEDPSSLIQVTLAGGSMPRTPHDRMAFTMPGFAHLADRELADLLTFIRNGWGNHASGVSVRDIHQMRREIAHKPTHYAPEAQQ